MLYELNIKNFIIIEQETVNFINGLNIITGETGSGKSLIIDAINVISGGRFSKDDIRTGENRAIIEAFFTIESEEVKIFLEEEGIEVEEYNSLNISREVNSTGKAVCRINGQIVTISLLKELSSLIFDIVGQNEQQLLLKVSKHLDYIDIFGEKSIFEIKEKVKALADNISNLEKKLQQLLTNSTERERKLDLIAYQIDEIEKAALRKEEEEELKNRKLILANSEKLRKNVEKAYNLLYTGIMQQKSAVDNIYESAAVLAEAASIDNDLNGYKETIESVLIQIEDIKHELRAYRDNIEFDDAEIENISERIDLINRLKRKYGSSISEILEFFNKMQVEYQELKQSETITSDIEKQLAALKTNYFSLSGNLSKERKKTAFLLQSLIEKELKELNMDGARFLINISSDSSRISFKGNDDVEFLLSANPGEAEKSLNKIASGGEISRVMLAIKNALSITKSAQCIVFDEVDAGIGGITANAVGQKIKNISKDTQVICITHLPQIARYADNHICIEKFIRNDKTFTKIRILKENEKSEELKRMLGGSFQNEQ